MPPDIQQASAPRALLINPWIYDFAAFDLWLKPLGLLYVAGYLRQYGYTLNLIDCLDRRNPQLLDLQGQTTPRMKIYGTGKYFRRAIKKPEVLRDIPYPYRRYGIPEEIFCDMLANTPPPDVILVTSMMSYWYPAVFRAIELAKKQFPRVPIVLGGVYASLCPEHASVHSGADYIMPGLATERLLILLDRLIGLSRQGPYSPLDLCRIRPAYDLYEHLDYVGILTSVGCPFRCTYCASQLLCPDFIQQDPDAIFREIAELSRLRNIRNFAFYDDALLMNFHKHLHPLLELLIQHKLNCNFHTPNGLHARYIDNESARLLFRAGFKTLRLSLETVNSNRQKQTGGKVTNDEFQQAVKALKQAGFHGDQIGVYLFVGLPGQTLEETEASIHYVHQQGLLVNLCEFSPIPGTREWEVLVLSSIVGPDDDPLLHNNSIFLYLKQRYRFEQIQALKNLVRALNAKIKARYV